MVRDNLSRHHHVKLNTTAHREHDNNVPKFGNTGLNATNSTSQGDANFVRIRDAMRTAPTKISRNQKYFLLDSNQVSARN